MNFDGVSEWTKKQKHYRHKDGCVATKEILTDGSAKWGEEFSYKENVGRLIPLTDYLKGRSKRLSNYKGKFLKVGESYVSFDRIYEALAPICPFQIRDLYLKEQPRKDQLVVFYYIDEWFVVAPIINYANDLAKGKMKVLTA